MVLKISLGKIVNYSIYLLALPRKSKLLQEESQGFIYLEIVKVEFQAELLEHLESELIIRSEKLPNGDLTEPWGGQYELCDHDFVLFFDEIFLHQVVNPLSGLLIEKDNGSLQRLLQVLIVLYSV